MAAISEKPQLTEDGEALAWAQRIAPGPASGERLSDADRDARWYALRTQARHEKRVREHLQWRKIEAFLPLYEKKSRWKNGCRPRVELPLFPGYIFVEIELRERVRVLEVPGAISFVGDRQGLWPLCDEQIHTLRNNLHLRKFEPHDYLVVGQRVRITKGSLANLTGVLIRKNASLRVVLALDQIMQGVSVEVDAEEVEAVTSSEQFAKPV